MSLAAELKKYDIDSIKEAVELGNTSRETMGNWMKNNPDRFEAFCFGLREKKIRKMLDHRK